MQLYLGPPKPQLPAEKNGVVKSTVEKKTAILRF